MVEDINALRLDGRISKDEISGDKVNKNAAKVRAKATGSAYFHCEDCDLTLQSDSMLKQCQLTTAHSDRVAAMRTSAPTTGVVANGA